MELVSSEPISQLLKNKNTMASYNKKTTKKTTKKTSPKNELQNNKKCFRKRQKMINKKKRKQGKKTTTKEINGKEFTKVAGSLLGVQDETYLSNGEKVLFVGVDRASRTNSSRKEHTNKCSNQNKPIKKRLELCSKLWVKKLNIMFPQGSLYEIEKKFYNWKFWVQQLRTNTLGSLLVVVSEKLRDEHHNLFIESVNKLFLDNKLWWVKKP